MRAALCVGAQGLPIRCQEREDVTILQSTRAVVVFGGMGSNPVGLALLLQGLEQCLLFLGQEKG